jgi:hypothetical protein
MTGLYSPINRLMEQVTRPKGTGAEYLAELQKKPGYKPAEAEDRDLQALMALPQMQRAEFMEKLKAQANKFPLKQRELTGSQTHHEDYTLPGGENYREILLHTPMPKGEGFPGVGHHFGGTPNILASVRVKDRVGPEQMGYTLQNKKSGFKGPHFKTVEEAKAAIENYPEHLRPMLQLAYSRAPGKKILHIEEIQSDWHQQGREKGYDTKIKEPSAKEREEWRILDSIDPNNRTQEQYARLNYLDHLMAKEPFGVPYGPHAKDWHELALKAMIQHAAENGYDQIAVTPGAEQARRYGLSSMIDELHYFPEEKKLTGYLGKGKLRVLNKGNVLPEELPQYVGKEVTKNLLQQPVGLSGSHVIKGKELEVGGEGMKGFYDKMVPTFLNKFGKKHGVQVQPGEIVVDDPNGHSQTDMLRASGIPEYMWGSIPYREQERMMKEYSATQPPEMAPVHTFDITPAMREDVLKNGIPRYNEGGEVDDDDYRGSHQAPGPHFGAQMHDVSGNGMYPQDFYSAKGLHYYANASDPTDRDAYSKITRVKGKPNAMVFIHRAIPTSVYNEAMKQEAPLKHMIRKGDWVAINKDYAKQHGDSVLRGDYKVASMRVPASHVWTNADSIHEWGYHPEEAKTESGTSRYDEGGSVSRETAEFINKSKGPDVLYHGGELTSNPTANKQGVIVNGIPSVSFTPSIIEAKSYARHNIGAINAIDSSKLKIYKGGNALLDKAYENGDFAAIKNAGFDGMKLRHSNEHVLFDPKMVAEMPRKVAEQNWDRGRKGMNYFNKWQSVNDIKPVMHAADTAKEKVTISPNMDVMQYELINRKAK